MTQSIETLAREIADGIIHRLAKNQDINIAVAMVIQRAAYAGVEAGIKLGMEQSSKAERARCFAYIREQASTLVGDGGTVFFKAYDRWAFTAMLDQIERTDNATIGPR